MKKNNSIYFIAGLFIIMAMILFNKESIRLNPDCDYHPTDSSCICYDDKVRIMENDNYLCIVPKCNLDSDCPTDMDEVSIQCVGKWSCVQHSCQWTCIK